MHSSTGMAFICESHLDLFRGLKDVQWLLSTDTFVHPQMNLFDASLTTTTFLSSSMALGLLYPEDRFVCPRFGTIVNHRISEKRQLVPYASWGFLNYFFPLINSWVTKPLLRQIHLHLYLGTKTVLWAGSLKSLGLSLTSSRWFVACFHR